MNKKFTGLIINDNDKFNNYLLDMFKKEESFKDLILYKKEDIDETRNFQGEFLIVKIESEKTLNYIKENVLKPIVVIAIVDEKLKGNLRQYMNYGVDEYLFSEFDYDDVYIKLNKMIQSLKKAEEIKNEKIQLNAMMSVSPYLSWFKDKEGRYIKVNNKFRDYFGKTNEEIIGKKWSLFGKEFFNDSEKCDNFTSKIINEKVNLNVEGALYGASGLKEFNIIESPLCDQFDNIIGTIGVACDITELKNKKAKLNMIMDNIPFGVWFKDNKGIILNANTKIAEIFNTTKERVIGNKEYDTNVPPYTSDKFVETEDYIVMEKKANCIFERAVYVNGEERFFKVYKSPVFDISNEVIGIVGLVQEITESKKSNDKTKKLAYTDYLTGLLNRRGLHKYINEQINYEDKTIFAIDIDNFKKLNDNYGTIQGDKVIKKVGETLRELCKGAVVARNSGDEFVVIWERALSEKEIKNKAEQILELIREQSLKHETICFISCSIGIAVDDLKCETYETLLLKGDMALNKAKSKGKNQYVIFTEELDREMHFNMEIENDIKKAVKNKEISLKYQPQFTPDRELIGFEGLFRWNNEKYKQYPVIDIIKAIEKYDVMDSVGEYILREAFIFAKEINEESKKKLVVFVNISPIQIMQTDFVYKFKKILNEVGVNPHFIGIEITETVLLDNIDVNIEKIRQLKDFGVTIALDDFGTGYSSLNYLVKLPLSKLKIDKSFIQGMKEGNEYEKLVGLIIDISHSLGLPVVAEGVEENHELDILKKMEADLVQGYLFDMPLEREEAKILAMK